MGIAELVCVFIPLLCACLCGFALFRKHTVAVGSPSGSSGSAPVRLSVIIPARNEARNLPHLLDSLRAQSRMPDEIIVVDDFSDDDSRRIAASYGVTVIGNPSLPPGWTGKNWAVWNGYKHASGELIAFIDADVRLAPHALESLIRARERAGGAISVIPFHYAVKFYEKLALITNILGVFAFTSPFEGGNPRKGLYGSCILTTREDYEKVRGHEGVKSELLDDLNLGAKFVEAGIPVANFIGHGMVSFRMYPHGIISELQGFSKGAVLSTSKLQRGTIVLTAAWTVGLIVSESAPLFINTSWAVPLLAGYVLYMLQIFYLVKYIGDFGKVMPALHILSSVFFIVVMLYSAYQVVMLGHVEWKGRKVTVGGRRES